MVSVHHRFNSKRYFSTKAIRGEDGFYRFRGAEQTVITAEIFNNLLKTKHYFAARRILKQFFHEYQIKEIFTEVWTYCHNHELNAEKPPQNARGKRPSRGHINPQDLPFSLSRREFAASSVI